VWGEDVGGGVLRDGIGDKRVLGGDGRVGFNKGTNIDLGVRGVFINVVLGVCFRISSD
jgi:hypothetical protein